MYPYDSMGRGFCQDDWEGKFVGVGCEVIVGESSLSIPLCKPFREASESENCVSNGFHNSLRLLSIAQQLELKQNHLYILLVFPDLYVLVCVQCNERKAVALAH